MTMQTVQIRLTKEQLTTIDEKVRSGVYQSRSEAIRDYIRKADFFESLRQFRSLALQSGLTEEETWEDDEKTRSSAYKRFLIKRE